MHGARLLLDGLFDDTALFPPVGRTLPAAVARHADHRRSAAAWMLGRLVVPIGALSAVGPLIATQAADAFPRPWGLSVIASGNVEDDRQALAEFMAHHGSSRRVAIESLEVTVGTPSDVRRVRVLASGAWDVYCEPTADLDSLLDAIALAGVRVKVRVASVDHTQPPAAEALARMLSGCVQRGISIKATGELQRALAADGSQGYFNLLVAAGVAAAAGAAAARAPDVVATLARILQLTTRPVFSHGGLLEWSDADGPRTEGPLHDLAPSARALVRSIGSHDFDASVSEARGLGLI